MPRKVLLVDDELLIFKMAQLILEKADFVVDTCANGASAWNKIQENPPDLVISDLVMPELDGYGLLKKIRQDKRTASMPVLLLTANPVPFLKRCLRSSRTPIYIGVSYGADYYLPKPFTASRFLSSIWQVFESMGKPLPPTIFSKINEKDLSGP
ncbi:MAG: response regulator [Candidatus Edwardsbacteria bacterium]